MDVKELSEWIFDMWHEWEGIYGISGEQSLKDSKKMDEVIERLKRGEKYKQIFTAIQGEILSDEYESVYGSPTRRGSIYKRYKILEQKYFPKE